MTRLFFLLFFIMQSFFLDAAGGGRVQGSWAPLVVVDAGHGGNDPGTIGGGFVEKTLTLQTAKMLKSELERLGVRVKLTRGKDCFLPLPKRVLIANQLKGQKPLFVSVHYNSAPHGRAHGTEVFYYPSKQEKRQKASKLLARDILHSLVESFGGQSRGVKEGDFHVIRETVVPAVLVEVCFLNNDIDCALLRSRKALQRAVQGIAKGIVYYYHSQQQES